MPNNVLLISSEQFNEFFLNQKNKLKNRISDQTWCDVNQEPEEFDIAFSCLLDAPLSLSHPLNVVYSVPNLSHERLFIPDNTIPLTAY